ncbi:MAG: nitroreductase family protein [Myxococcales bacterium]|nr:nitroreductase family protein [Myxococcales bacterium]MDH5308113.1 nitroreductase family protein [Myxococcales bacterium]MDH5565827.1 nitroreductase family protein [Myxococcales bacterium]
MHVKLARTDHPVQEAIAQRWSPYLFDAAPVAPDALRSLFEAARWAASSFNEQPWRFIVALREAPEAFERLLSCLIEANQAWAKAAPVLALGVVKTTFTRGGKPNRVAAHDLGLATGNLMLEASARGLSVHAMAGIEPERARALYAIPEEAEAFTALAIGYRRDAAGASHELAERDRTPRTRKPLAEFVFGAAWGEPAAFVAG